MSGSSSDSDLEAEGPKLAGPKLLQDWLEKRCCRLQRQIQLLVKAATDEAHLPLRSAHMHQKLAVYMMYMTMHAWDMIFHLTEGLQDMHEPA